MNTIPQISTSVSPVALISACGLITLALYNRLGAIQSRIRALQDQKMGAMIKFADAERPEQARHQQILLDILDSQIRQGIVKATSVQNGLQYLLFAVLAFLICAALNCVTAFDASIILAAEGLQILGLVLFVAGVCLAIQELRRSVRPLEEQNAQFDQLLTQLLPPAQNVQPIRVMKTA